MSYTDSWDYKRITKLLCPKCGHKLTNYKRKHPPGQWLKCESCGRFLP